jgi:hypothetical protein
MSDHYEIVISCFLDEDVPESVLEVLRWHLGLCSQRPPHLDEAAAPYPVLVPDSDSRLPGGEITRLRRQRLCFGPAGHVHGWGLYARGYYLDDDLGEFYAILDIVAPHVNDHGYGGHIRNEYDEQDLSIVFFTGGRFEIHRR